MRARARVPGAWLLVLGALATWGVILGTGGVVSHPKREHAGAGALTVTTDGSAGAGAPAVASLERRLAQRALPETAWLELERGVDRSLLAWHVARTSSAVAANPPADGELGRWLAQHPLAGTHVRGGLRLACFGAQVVHEGDLLPGAARVERIERAGVVLATDAGPVQLETSTSPAGPR